MNARDLPSKFRSLLSGKDNVSLDVVRVLVGAFGVALIGFTGWSIAQGHVFDPVSYVAGCGGLLTAGAAALRLKAPTEPGGG